jgi:trk system potassium uptake protein TrkA
MNNLALPKDSRVMRIYRKEKLIIPRENEHIELDDEVIVVTHRKNLEALHAQLDMAAKVKK